MCDPVVTDTRKKKKQRIKIKIKQHLSHPPTHASNYNFLKNSNTLFLRCDFSCRLITLTASATRCPVSRAEPPSCAAGWSPFVRANKCKPWCDCDASPFSDRWIQSGRSFGINFGLGILLTDVLELSSSCGRADFFTRSRLWLRWTSCSAGFDVLRWRWKSLCVVMSLGYDISNIERRLAASPGRYIESRFPKALLPDGLASGMMVVGTPSGLFNPTHMAAYTWLFSMRRLLPSCATGSAIG